MIKEYCVLESDRLDTLVRMVNARIRKRYDIEPVGFWAPQGGVLCTPESRLQNEWFYQAMVRTS